ncbi:Extracellular triacylglycerol [Pleurostoma richardsiae]|uniref:Extracellular triacylglycerol n=1 Tax=Pleurostoma richardsiae TaxID=41990 RepID=A0AA38RVH2_9PEZI|nr:Extracellular triacylglycerol [Pleurostoma richardsiae]
MRPGFCLLTCFLFLVYKLGALAAAPRFLDQHPLSASDHASSTSISLSLFAELERLARLVDITYCVGTTGVSPPFSCASRCKDFPSLQLASTWNTGVLMSDSCGYIAVDHGDEHHEGAIIVAFRGTYSITNTVVDLSTVPQEYVPYPEPDQDEAGGENPGREHKCANCTVHMGFLDSWRQARRLVLPVLKDVRGKHPSYPIHLVGHSLGGAVAALAALELKVSLGWDDLMVTTFGEPRVGNDGFVSFLDKVLGLNEDGSYDPDLERRIYRRVTHADDPVPLLPLWEWGYRPHAGEIFITKAELPPEPQDLRLCRGDSDERCSGGAEGEYAAVMLGALLRGEEDEADVEGWTRRLRGFPPRLKLWQLFFAHRDYFWRLGLCVPGGDPADWGRGRYNLTLQGAGEL